MSDNQRFLAFVARDAALQRVDQNADADWKERAYAAVLKAAREMPEFISDDIWDTGLKSTREDRALGPVLLRAARDMVCVKTDRVRPSVRSHLSGKPVWRSLIFCGAGSPPPEARREKT